MSERYDIAIIGSGPAGLSAALNAKIRNKKYILFGNSSLSLKLEKAHQINNYLGFPNKTGAQLQGMFKEHLNEMGVEITEQKVTNIYHMGDYFSLLANNEVYESETIILATGVQVGKKIEGEEAFLGRGVSYCATCDGSLYRDKVVTVIGYDKSEEEEVDFLAGLAAKVYYIPMYKEAVQVAVGVEVIKDRPVEIVGDTQLRKLILKEQELETDGLFILRESISPNTLLPGLEIVDNHIQVDRLMSTSIPGCFAAGDIVGKPYQYIKSAGEGNIAALSAASYVDQKRRGAK